MPRTLERPASRMRFDKRTSSWLNRSRCSLSCSMTGTITKALHTTAAPHADRFRPRDGAICALGTTTFARMGYPGVFWYTALASMSQGKVYEALNLASTPLVGLLPV